MTTEFRARMRAVRQSRKLSQGELAIAIGVTREYVNNLETGRRNPSRALARLIALVLEDDELRDMVGVRKRKPTAAAN